MKLAAAPILRRDVGDGFGEVPAVSVKVLSVVLTLAVGMICWFAQNDRSILPRTLTVGLAVLNADLNALRVVRHHITFGDREAAVAGFHLDTVIGNAQADSESESFRQPVSGRAWIGVTKHRNHRAGWYRAVESHLKTVSGQRCCSSEREIRS